MRLKDFAIVIRTKKTTWNIRGTNSLSDFLRQARRVTSVQLDVHLTTHASFAAYSPRILWVTSNEHHVQAVEAVPLPKDYKRGE